MTERPVRIQRKRTKGWRMPPNTIYVGRPSQYGNPYPVGGHNNIDDELIITRQQAVDLYRKYVIGNYCATSLAEIQAELHGKNRAIAESPCRAGEWTPAPELEPPTPTEAA